MESNDPKMIRVVKEMERICYKNKSAKSISENNSINGCSKTFQDLFCWPELEIGNTIKLSCKNRFIFAENENEFATGQCTIFGNWSTNVTNCGNLKGIVDLEAEEKIEKHLSYENFFNICDRINEVGYGLSLIALIIAIIIFLSLKRLHSERNKLHLNLFISYFLFNLMFFAKEFLFKDGLTFSNEIHLINGTYIINYPWTCKFFHVIYNYLYLTNYLFLLMEGVYLNNLIFFNVFSESHDTKIYCAIGWVMPIFLIIPWTMLRYRYEDTNCWNNHRIDYIRYFLDLPTRASVIVNFILFVLLLRILKRKIDFTSTFIQHRTIKYRKLLKSTLILIPLYGIPYSVYILLELYESYQRDYHNNENELMVMIWIYFTQLFKSFQGFIAASVYCLFNSDVREEVLRFYTYNSLYHQNNKEIHRSRTISTNTQQFSLQSSDDTLENLKLFGIIDEETQKAHQQQQLTTTLIA